MPAVTFVEHSGKRILVMDFSNDRDARCVAETARDAMHIVRSSGEPHSIRGLLDFSGTPLSGTVRDTMKNMSRNNGPYMKSVAFLGLGAALSPVFSGLLFLTGRKNHKVFRKRLDALDWLAKS
ncbi:MAG TPA: hypothetical protein VK569_01860 [Bacteroidota bacterium]|nr:hypothetical protein [Bacteroidota bacterium]